MRAAVGRLLLGLVIAGCGGDDEAGVDVPQAPADVGPPPPVQCGAPTFATGTALRRYPYLQSVTQTSARVAWTSTHQVSAAVEILRVPDGSWERFDATAEVFDVARTGDTEDYFAYEARLEGLEPGRAVCYRLVHDDEIIADGLELTAAWTDPDRPLRVLAFGDSGTGSPGQLAVRDALMQHEVDVFLHLGDMAYGEGTFAQFEQFVFDVYRDLLYTTPAWPTMGNHEYKTGGGQPYLDVYSLPEQAPRPEEQERYYSFDYGDVHLVSVDSNDGTLVLSGLYELSGEPSMLQWLRDDLAASDARWKIVFFHHPPYSSSERDPNHLVRDQLLPILEEGGVDLVLTGHDHHYERTVPIWQGAPAQGESPALTYVIAGAGGADVRPATGDWFTAEVNSETHSFVLLTVEGCSLTGRTLTAQGDEVDSFSLNGCQ